MELLENIRSIEKKSIIENELGPENLKNIKDFGVALSAQAKEKQIEVHLILVGGNVRPEKRGKFHKDIDLVLYSPQLSTEIFIGQNEHPKFDIFAEFIQKTCKQLNWKNEIKEPWFSDFEFCGDGKVVLFPGKDSKPIEILPVRQDRLSGSFDQYLKSDINPNMVLF